MNKSLITNLISIIVATLGYFLENHALFMIGIFALSGAITNTLAIHMLFEKVPFLYGSGVIEQRFEEFKEAIHNLIMNQFFTKENLKTFFDEELSAKKSDFDLTKVIEKTDFSLAFESLKQAVIESPFGSMLGMLGGEEALTPLKEPFEKKIKAAIIKISENDTFKKALSDNFSSSSISDDIYEKVSTIVNRRLDELTPLMVKEIVQKMIRKHLGWLVVWGGVFGGVIGFISSFLV